MKNQINLTQESINYLAGRKIISAGPNYIKLDDGAVIYLNDNEIETLNDINEN